MRRQDLPTDFLEVLDSVTNKRARFVIDTILGGSARHYKLSFYLSVFVSEHLQHPDPPYFSTAPLP